MKNIALLLSIFALLLSACTSEVSTTQPTTQATSEEETSTSKRTALSPDEQIEYLFETIERIPLSNSSCFSEYGYSKDAEALLVTFLDSGVSYIYTEFPYSELIEFEQAPSKGKYYNSKIKGNYPCYRED